MNVVNDIIKPNQSLLSDCFSHHRGLEACYSVWSIVRIELARDVWHYSLQLLTVLRPLWSWNCEVLTNLNAVQFLSPLLDMISAPNPTVLGKLNKSVQRRILSCWLRWITVCRTEKMLPNEPKRLGKATVNWVVQEADTLGLQTCLANYDPTGHTLSVFCQLEVMCQHWLVDYTHP
jgi:hypothetical protein